MEDLTSDQPGRFAYFKSYSSIGYLFIYLKTKPEQSDPSPSSVSFFQCPFSANVWNGILKQLYCNNRTNNWQGVLNWLQNNRSWSSRLQKELTYFGFAATVYGIWTERNRRFYQKNGQVQGRPYKTNPGKHMLLCYLLERLQENQGKLDVSYQPRNPTEDLEMTDYDVLIISPIYPLLLPKAYLAPHSLPQD